MPLYTKEIHWEKNAGGPELSSSRSLLMGVEVNAVISEVIFFLIYRKFLEAN